MGRKQKLFFYCDTMFPGTAAMTHHNLGVESLQTIVD
jgi:hypothetical protein